VMNVLSAILPGARQVRAPLAAGATWLLTIWLAIEPGLGEPNKATGIYASVVRLSDATGTTVVLAVIGFLAYMLGSVTTSAVLALDRYVLPKASRGNPIRSLVVAKVWAAEDRLRELHQPRRRLLGRTTVQAKSGRISNCASDGTAVGESPSFNSSAQTPSSTRRLTAMKGNGNCGLRS
jgi:hypothetical protein